jgi:hypothetical protein
MTLAYGVPIMGIGEVGPLAPAVVGEVRQDGNRRTVSKRSPVIGIAAVMAVGYVLGAKAGRQRYEQIAGTYRAVTGSPRTKAIIDAGRRKVADRVSPDPQMVNVTQIDASTSVLLPEGEKNR